MRSFTSVLQKLLLFSFALFALAFQSRALEFGENDYHIVSSNTTDGHAVIYIDRYDGGNQIEEYLYIEALINGNWTWIVKIHHYMNDGNKYSTDYNGISVSLLDLVQTVDTDGDGDTDEYVSKYTINESPSGVYNSEVMFRIKEVDDDGSYKTFNPFTLIFYKPNAPQSLNVSQNECNKVDLSWSAPDNIRSDGTNTYQIYKNDTLVVTTANTSYSHTSVTDGTEYDYKVRLKTVYNSTTNYGVFTNEVTGYSKPIPDAPTNVSASDDLCDGTIYIQWQWTDETPDNFEIQRSTSSTTGFTSISTTLPGTQNYYENTPPLRNTIYYYKVRAKNDCGDWGTFSSVVSGKTPSVPTAPSNFNSSIVNNTIHLTWTDNSSNETGFLLKRSNVTSGVVTEYELAAGTTSFNDDDVELCVAYVYKILAEGDCGNSSEVSTAQIQLAPDLSNTFWDGALKASKGYYADIVHLEWDNNNRSQIDLFYIYRKEYGSTDSTLITTLSGTLTSYDDKYVENSVLYEYSIKAEGLCNETSVFSNAVSSIGFKTPTAVVSGQVTYQDDNPVKGVTITANSTELPEFSSISLNGTNSYMQIEGLQNSLPTFTFQAYLKFNSTENASIFNRGEQYNLNYSSNAFVFSVGENLLTCSYIPAVDSFVQVTTVFDGASSYIYINGKLKASKSGVPSPASSSSDFIVGKHGVSYFNGYVDEMRIWNVALDSSKVALNFDKYIAGNESGLIGYYRLNENIDIDLFFDLSRTGNGYNENHGTLHNCSYADVNPTIEQLWFKAVTDATGNYLITGIPYLSGGSIYTIVPMMAPHEFNPTSKTLFVGDGASVHNNIDFVDISTVTVTAQVFYKNTTFPVGNVYVKLDGQIQIDSNENIIQTNEDGTVDFEVPYGNHYISFEKANHVFEKKYYPGIDEYGNIIRHNFTEPVQIKINDTTRVKLAGKVVGGPIEADKDLLSNLDPTKNNIGVVAIELTTVRGYDIDTDGTPKTVSTTTDSENGYFEFYLLPEVYKPNGTLSIRNSLYSFTSDEDLAVIDMSSQFIEYYETDSIYVNKTFSHLDTTAEYNLRRDWIYRTTPEFSVLNEDGGEIISEQKYIYEGDVVDTIPLAVEQGDSIYYPFGYPVFLFGNQYSMVINAYEEYENADTHELDHVPVTDGELIISNDLALEDKNTELSLDENGEAEYTFLADFPNIASPYTKNLNITFKAGSTIVQWPGVGDPYEAYILGGKPSGNNFVTTGPAVVDYILRDPPGSGSSATLQKGYVTAQSTSFSVTNTTDLSVALAYQLGAKIATTAGSPFFMVQTEFETDNYIKGAIESSLAGSTGYEQTTQLSFGESFSTSDDPLFVGSDADVFIGHSTNIVYGISKMMEIMPTTEVQSGKDTIAKYDSYAISIEDGLRVNPEFDTYFIYSQRIIEDENIPHLEKLRNIVLEGANYQKVFTDINDSKYGSNNDDRQAWGSSASDDLYSGPSYIYTPANDSIIDSVRFYNEQISNWQKILAMNEEQKLNAISDNNHQNISFGAGSVYQSSIGSEDTYVSNTSFAFSVSLEVATSLGFSLNKAGFRLDASIKNTTSGQTIWSDTSTESREVSYTLSDQDAYNYITVDVLKCQSGNGPVFKTRGGQTSCPYEGGELTEYFEPGEHTLNYATMRIEGMQIAVENPISPLVPETAPAVFTLYLSNDSEAEKDGWYILGVDVATNPYGAKVKMDGSDINDGVAIYVPYGETVEKTIEVWKGRSDINEYEDIYIYLGSTCEYVWKDVAISAYFAAACSEVEFDYPGNGWIINTSNNDSMYVIISGYNLQHEGFEDIHFQYTPSGNSNWTTARIFTNDASAAGELNTTYINGATTIEYYWDMRSLPDRTYDIRLVTHCEDGSANYSNVLSGILDGQRPQVFGTPQPADGILEVDDNIQVQFNEDIETGLLTVNNFQIKGSLNSYDIEHKTFLRFDGSTNYAVIPSGISFNDKSFTIEFWMKPGAYNNSVIFSQGNDPETSIEIGLEGSDHTYFKIGSMKYLAPFQFTSVVPATEWQHMAYVFDYENSDVFIYQNDKIILEERSQNITVNNAGKIYIGKSAVSGDGYFAGDLHELRIWSKIWSVGEIYANQYTTLSGNEVGLYGYWPMDEAYGELAADKAASRHMELSALWVVEPSGTAWNFSGNNFLEVSTGYFAIIPEMDYTIEFWFKSPTPTDTVCLFSNQKGDGKEGSGLLNKAFSICASPNGKIWVYSKGNIFEATSNNYFDNNWHHFALVVRRSGNVTSYIDGEAQNEKENTVVAGIAGSKMYFGVRKWDNVGGTGEDFYYSGKMDEIRIWDMAKSLTQIKLDMNSQLEGDEFGLKVYLPFEKYSDDGFGNQVLNNSMVNKVSDSSATDAVPVSVGGYTTDAPNIKEARPVEDISFDFVASSDEIIISPKEYLITQLEKNIIEITVEAVEDKNGNRMASPATWTAYVHRNQVRWEDESRSFVKEIYKTMTFVATIKNTGGQQVGFSITNLPAWLSASPSSGVINPESSLEITFTINAALNIGEYNVDIVLHTENGFDEKLPISVRVYKTPPSWTIDPSKFEYSMNMVGKVKIEGVLSTDVYDMVAVFKEGTDSIRGYANVRYMEDFDSYLVFLNVYGNNDGERLSFRIWDASAGQILDQVSPYDVTFVPNGIKGTTLNPVIFEASGLSRQYIPLAKGWNWVSFNKLAANQNNLNSFFASLEPDQNDQVKTHGGGFNTFDLTTGWVAGSIDSIDNKRMYQMKISHADTIIYSGEDIDPETNPISLTAGWNHIGYLPDLSMDVNDALRLFTADTSEIVKSQYAFSMYDPRAGWIGTLDLMQPGVGYMMYSNKAAVLTYPNTTVYKSAILYATTTPPSGWLTDVSAYDANLSIVARIDQGEFLNIEETSQLVLGAFINDECRGYTSLIENSGLDFNPFFLNVNNSANGQIIEFRLYDGLTGNLYQIRETEPFVKDAVFGSTQSPFVLTLSGLLTGTAEYRFNSYLRCYPNPFTEQVNIEFNGKGDKVTINVLNAAGAVINQIYDGYSAPGKNSTVWSGRNQNGSVVSSGMYYIRYISGDSVETIKISKTR